MRRGHHRSTDGNHGEIVTALRSVSGVTVHSLAGVGLRVSRPAGRRSWAHVPSLSEIKDGEKTPSRRTLTPDQRTMWIEKWTRLSPW